MRDEPAKSKYLSVLQDLRKINLGVFGLQLDPNWKQYITDLKTSFAQLTDTQGMPLTPKFHIILQHIKEWVEMCGRSLGTESEQPGESLHHVWRVFLERTGEVKNKESKKHMDQVLWCLTKLNSDHV